MPASEETYRRQPTLHIIFAISSIVMTLSIVWMIMADHLRPWKQVQRDFHEIEREKLKATEREALEKQQAENQAKIAQIDEQIKEAEARRGAAGRRAQAGGPRAERAHGQDGRPGHQAEVQEGRAGQPAQPLRRHDRTRRGDRRPAAT